MSRSSILGLVLLAAASLKTHAKAQAGFPPLWSAPPQAAPAATVSSSLGDSGIPSASPARSFSPVIAPPPAKKQPPTDNKRVLPFSKLAIATKTGSMGLGGQIATPLTNWLVLRGGAQLFNFNDGLAVDGANYQGLAKLKFGQLSLDIFPFRGFHISPGFLYNHSWFSASMSVPAGTSFTLGGNTYTSSTTDPVTGSANIVFARSIMPALTLGFGNMITRGRKHWTVPFEVGAAYTGPYSMKLAVQGSACIVYGCMSTSTPLIQQSVVQEQSSLNETMKHFQLYPIVSSGISYRF